MKCPDGIVKGLLRHAGRRASPQRNPLEEKKPLPERRSTALREKLLGYQLKEVLADPNAPIHSLLDTKKVYAFVNSPSDDGKPWYRQLMAGPQMLAYVLQVNYWLAHYKTRF